MTSTTVHFRNADGEALAGILDRPAGPVRAFALFAHCFTCSKDLKAVRHLANALNGAGIAVLRFDFTGLGESEGDFSASNFSANVADLERAAGWMREEGMAPSLLIGHSLGGTAVLAAAARIEGIEALVTIGSPASPDHVRKLFRDDEGRIASDGEAEVDLGGRPFTVRKQFLEDLEAHSLPDSVADLRIPLLVMHSPRDTQVSVDEAGRIFAAAKHPKSFVSLDDADHLLSREDDARYAAHVLAAWASRYTSDAVTSAADDAAVIATTTKDGFRTELLMAGHQQVADEPESLGGSNEGPSPYDYLAASLASCTTMTLQMYARRKQLSLESAVARVTHRRVHARDCADCDTKDGRIDEFTRELTLVGDLDDDARNRLVEIADRCPVHRTLHGEIKVRTTLAD